MERTANNTRRQFIAGSAGALGGLAVGGAFVSPILAQQDDEDGGSFADDVEILNYARTLEFLEAAFYRQGLENIDEAELCNCDALGEESYLRDVVWEELQTILAHEEAHVELLGSAVSDLGGDPVEELEFDFGVRVEYPMAFLATAAALEDLGVAAYAGAAPQIESIDILAPALGIHSVEARHASFLHTLNAESGFPDAVDAALPSGDVLEVAAEFIVGEEPPDDQEDPLDPVDEPATNETNGEVPGDEPTTNETNGEAPGDEPTTNETGN